MSRRGMTLLEMVVAVTLMGSLFLTLHAAGTLASKWRRTVDEVSTRAAREARLAAAIAPALRAGEALPGLSITADGRLVEEPVAGAPVVWAPPAALAVRTATGHVLFTHEGGRAVRRRIDQAGGKVELEVLAAGVAELRFEVLWPQRCAGWRVRFDDGGEASGVAARRLDTSRPPPPAPRAAPRWSKERAR